MRLSRLFIVFTINKVDDETNCADYVPVIAFLRMTLPKAPNSLRQLLLLLLYVIFFHGARVKVGLWK